MKLVPKSMMGKLIWCLCFIGHSQTFAQGYGLPLTMQGVNHTGIQSVAARSAGGLSVGLTNDVSLMFSNPASLSSLQSILISLGGLQANRYAKQEQHFGGLQGYSAFTPLVEGTTDQLSNPPDSTLINQTDSVQRPFDSIGPDWSRSKSKGLPIQVFLAVPLTLGDLKLVVGVGAVEYADLSSYYQNNNCFSPSVLSVLNGTISTSGLNTNPYLVQWYQYYQQREGSIRGYGGAVSLALSEKLSFGVSGMILTGNSDDQEARVGRGRLEFFANSLRLDRPGVTSYIRKGTSDFSGQEFTLSAKFTSKRLNGIISITPPTTITRKFSTTSFSQDSVAVTKQGISRLDSIVVTSTALPAGGEDKIALPWRGTIGFNLTIKEDLSFGMEFEVRSYALAEYTGSDGTVSNPWLSSTILHVGGEYRASDWFALRAGVSNYSEVFEPLSNPIRGDAVSYPVYSLGCGISFENVRLNIAYEYSDMKYVDTWSNAASINREISNNIMASISYVIPWMD